MTSKWVEYQQLDGRAKEDKQTEIFLDYMMGDLEAVRFLNMCYFIAHTWDDLVDRDKPVDDDSINTAFWYALVGIPQNQFYHINKDALVTQFNIFCNQWLDSNELSKLKGDPQVYAFVLKDTLMDLVSQCAYIKGGFEHMRNVSMEIRQLLIDHHNLEQYMWEMNHA